MVYQLTTRDINSLISRFRPKVKNYAKKETIKTGTKYQNKLCLVTNGMVYLCVENDDFERSIIKIFTVGDVFSHAMILPDEQGVSYFIAKKASKIAYFDRAELTKYLINDNEHADKLFGIVHEQLEQENFSHNYILQQKTIKSKLICYFRYESIKQQSKHINVPIPYSDLAEYIGADRSSMMKELSRMKEDKLIVGEKRSININFD